MMEAIRNRKVAIKSQQMNRHRRNNTVLATMPHPEQHSRTGTQQSPKYKNNFVLPDYIDEFRRQAAETQQSREYHNHSRQTSTEVSPKGNEIDKSAVDFQFFSYTEDRVQ